MIRFDSWSSTEFAPSFLPASLRLCGIGATNSRTDRAAAHVPFECRVSDSKLAFMLSCSSSGSLPHRPWWLQLRQ